VVQGRAKRRKTNSTGDSSEEAGANNRNPKKTPINTNSANVYERLAYGQRTSRVVPTTSTSYNPPIEDYSGEEVNRNGYMAGRLMCPRSAMDLPQTKSSMAKIAYSRQLLWQRYHKKVLTEKLSAKRRQQNLATILSRGRSLPSLKTSKLHVCNDVDGVETLYTIH
jgi:hypothetical protein